MSIADITASTTVECIAAKDIKVDPRVQRALVLSRVRKIAADLDLDGIGVLTVSLRDTGEYYVIDGQHRLAALAVCGVDDYECYCHVYTGLTLAREAALFRTLNAASKPTPFDQFTKGVVAGDEECCAINNTVTALNLLVTDQNADGCIRAVVALQGIYRGGGSQGLHDTLSTLITAWGTSHDAFEGGVLAGVGVVVNRYAGDVDLAILGRKLAKYPGGALGLLGDARGLRKFRKASIANCVAENVVGHYNKGRREGQLGPL